MKVLNLVKRCFAALTILMSATAQGEAFDHDYERYVEPIYPAELHEKEVIAVAARASTSALRWSGSC